MKKLSIYLYIYLLLAINVSAQVTSNIYSEKSKVFDFYPQFNKLRTIAPEIIMPGFDINRLLEEDEAVKGKDVPYRFGKGFDVNYSLADGIWTKVDSGSVWLMKVTSPKAYSINFIFNELFLPVNAELYIYSYDGSMVYGPVTSKQNMERDLFLTDIIQGESVILYLYVPKNKEVSTRLVISRIVHGYKNTVAGLFESGKGLGDSGDCEENVVCFAGWSSESRAVALVLLASGTELCSGSLLNNTSRNFRAYFLTAFHCADCNPENGTISYWEKYHAEHWAFRFNYKMTLCEGGQVASYFTYNNDDIIAAWNTSDFILVELDDSPLAHPLVSFLGWDNTGAIPTEATCIHHPQGDVMKISFDYESPTSAINNTHWFVDDWDIGSTELGSSGSPLFNENKKVVGQDHGGDGYPPCHPEKGTYFGKFSSSWYPGGGTETTRLIDWLDECGTGASTLNTLSGAYVTGPDIICTSNNNPFILHNIPLGKTVTWSANSSLVTPSSGTGSFAAIHATCNDIGNTEIIFTISDACGSSPIEKVFLVAGPDYSEVDLDVTYSTGQPAPKSGGIFLLCPSTYYYFYVDNNSDCSTSGYQWTLPPSLTLVYTYNNMACVYTGSNPGGNVRVKATTCCSGCGSNVQILSDYVGTYWNCGGYYFSMSPNPADDYVEITAEKKEYDTKGIVSDNYKVKIFNNLKSVVYESAKTNQTLLRISTKHLTNGTYYIHFTAGEQKEVKQLIIIH